MPIGTRTRRAVSRLAFPIVMGAALALAIHLMQGGADPLLAFVCAQLPAFLVVIALERVCPHHPDWNRDHGDLRVDVGHILTVTSVSTLAEPGLRALALVLGAWLLGDHALSLWPRDSPLALQLVLALVIGELGQYWVHRLQHEWSLLWRFHALHHSAPRLYWLNAARFHPVDTLMNNFAVSVPLVMLGADPRILSLWLLFASVHGIFQHCNLPVQLGPLNWIFSMAELHRWHHSRRVVESNRNYGQNLIVWDVVFGTRYLPADRQPPLDIGLADLPHYPTTWLAQELAPFRWKRILSPGGGRPEPHSAGTPTRDHEIAD